MTDACSSRAIDIGFMPADDERRTRVDACGRRPSRGHCRRRHRIDHHAGRGTFQTTGVAIAVQKDRPAALEYVKDFVESAKANGVVRRAFDDAGLNLLPVAP